MEDRRQGAQTLRRVAGGDSPCDDLSQGWRKRSGGRCRSQPRVRRDSTLAGRSGRHEPHYRGQWLWKVMMRVIADLCLIPIGVGVSVSREIAACECVLAEAGLKTNLHAYGTNIEGEWDEVFAAIKRCHEVVHAMGTPRISSSLRF